MRGFESKTQTENPVVICMVAKDRELSEKTGMVELRLCASHVAVPNWLKSDRKGIRKAVGKNVVRTDLLRKKLSRS